MAPPICTGWPVSHYSTGVSGWCGGGRTHGAANEHGLAGELVVHRDERVVRREGARAALAVHQQLLQLAIHHVLLHLRPQAAGMSCTSPSPHSCTLPPLGSAKAG